MANPDPEGRPLSQSAYNDSSLAIAEQPRSRLSHMAPPAADVRSSSSSGSDSGSVHDESVFLRSGPTTRGNTRSKDATSEAVGAAIMAAAREPAAEGEDVPALPRDSDHTVNRENGAGAGAAAPVRSRVGMARVKLTALRQLARGAENGSDKADRVTSTN